MIISTEKENGAIYKECQYVKKLHFEDNSPNSKVFYDNNGNLRFLGSVLADKKVQWKNLYTNNIAEHGVYADRLRIKNNHAEAYLGEFVATQSCNEGEVIFVDFNLEQLRKAKNDYADFMFHMTQCAEIDGIRKMDDQGIMRDLDIRQWKPFSRIRIHCLNNSSENFICIEKFKGGMEIEQKRHMTLYDNDLQFAYYPNEQKILFRNKMIPVDCDMVRQLMITCRAKQMTKEVIQMDESTICILDSKGYVYLEPFSLQEELSGLKVVVIASRQMDLEIYDHQSKMWKKLEQNKLDNIKKGQQIQLRMCAKFGDRIHEAAIVR